MSNKAREFFQLERLTFFSDAVFAIAITLLVIEIRLPPLHHATESDLANALLQLIPQYVGFIVSFFVIGRFWLGHHRAFGQLSRVDDKLVWRNLLFLLTVAFMPFPTAIISEFPASRVAVGLYACWLMAAGLLNRFVITHAMLTAELRAPDADVAMCERMARASWSPILIGALALAFGLIMPLLAMIPLLGSPIILALFGRVYVDAKKYSA